MRPAPGPPQPNPPLDRLRRRPRIPLRRASLPRRRRTPRGTRPTGRKAPAKGRKTREKWRGQAGRGTYLLKEEIIRTASAVAWSAGRVPGISGVLGFFRLIYITLSFRYYLILSIPRGLYIRFDVPISF